MRRLALFLVLLVLGLTFASDPPRTKYTGLQVERSLVPPVCSKGYEAKKVGEICRDAATGGLRRWNGSAWVAVGEGGGGSGQENWVTSGVDSDLDGVSPSVKADPGKGKVEFDPDEDGNVDVSIGLVENVGQVHGTRGLRLDRGSGNLMMVGLNSCTALETDSSGNVLCGSDDTGNDEADDLSDNVLDDIGNVDTSGATAGQVLKFDGSVWKPGTDQTGEGGSGGPTMDDAVMVGNGTGADEKVIPACNGSGQKLLYDADQNAWNCGTDDTGTDTADDLSDNILSDLSDVSSESPASGQALKWNGSAWAPAADDTGNDQADDLSDNILDDVGDVDASGVADGECLKYDGAAGKWVPGECGTSSGGGSDWALGLDTDQDGDKPYIRNNSDTVEIDADEDGTPDVKVEPSTDANGEIAADDDLTFRADADNNGTGDYYFAGMNSCTLKTDSAGKLLCGSDSGGGGGPTGNHEMWVGDGSQTLSIPLRVCDPATEKLIYNSDHTWSCEADVTGGGGGSSDAAKWLDNDADGTPELQPRNQYNLLSINPDDDRKDNNGEPGDPDWDYNFGATLCSSYEALLVDSGGTIRCEPLSYAANQNLELEELHDVDSYALGTDPADDGKVLTWNSTKAMWEPRDPPSGGSSGPTQDNHMWMGNGTGTDEIEVPVCNATTEKLIFDGTAWSCETDREGETGSSSDYAVGLDDDKDGTNPYLFHVGGSGDPVEVDPSRDADSAKVRVNEYSDGSMEIQYTADVTLNIISDGNIGFIADHDGDGAGGRTHYYFGGMTDCSALEIDGSGYLVCGTDDTGNDAQDDLSDNVLSDLSDVSATSPADGQVLKWNGTEWAPADDATGGTSESAKYLDSDGDATPEARAVSGTFRIDPDDSGGYDYFFGATACSDYEVLSTLDGNVIGCNPMKDVANSSNGITVADLKDVDDTMSPSTGQVLKWDGEKWTAADDEQGGGSDLAFGQMSTVIDEDFDRLYVVGNSDPYYLGNPHEWKVDYVSCSNCGTGGQPTRYDDNQNIDTVKLTLPGSNGDGLPQSIGVAFVAVSDEGDAAVERTGIFHAASIRYLEWSVTVKFSVITGYIAIGVDQKLTDTGGDNSGDQGFFFKYTGSGTWKGVATMLGGSCIVDLGVAPNTLDHTYRAVVDEDRNEVKFYIDGSLKGTCDVSGQTWSGSPLEFGLEWRTNDEDAGGATVRIDSLALRKRTVKTGR